MHKATEDLNKASHILLDAEVSLRTMSLQRQQCEKEIAMLNSVEANLEENIRILKRRNVIVMASEYRKVKTDLSTARNRRAFLRVDRENCIKLENRAEANYEKAKAEYERLFDLLHSSPNNVIEFKRK